MGFRGGAGKKDRLMALQVLPNANTATIVRGEVTGNPVTDIANIRCAFEPLGGREFPESQKRHTETTGRFRIDYRPDVNVRTLPETHLALYIEDYDADSQVTRTFDIKHAEIIGRREEIHIEVDEVR